MNKPIKAAWDKFDAKVIGQDAPAIQHTEMQKAFYAGAWTVLTECWGIGDKSVSEEAGMEILSQMVIECQQFNKEVLKQSR